MALKPEKFMLNNLNDAGKGQGLSLTCIYRNQDNL